MEGGVEAGKVEIILQPRASDSFFVSGILGSVGELIIAVPASPAKCASGWRLGAYRIGKLTRSDFDVSASAAVMLNLANIAQPLVLIGYSDGTEFHDSSLDTLENHQLLGACRAYSIMKAIFGEIRRVGKSAPKVLTCGLKFRVLPLAVIRRNLDIVVGLA